MHNYLINSSAPRIEQTTISAAIFSKPVESENIRRNVVHFDHLDNISSIFFKKKQLNVQETKKMKQTSLGVDGLTIMNIHHNHLYSSFPLNSGIETLKQHLNFINSVMQYDRSQLKAQSIKEANILPTATCM